MARREPDAFLPLKSNWFHVLVCLIESEQHGYGIMQDVLERTDGKVRLWPATLYGSLKRLIKEGLIVESAARPAPELDDARRRYYALTPLGRRVLDLESQRLKDLVRALDTRRRQAARS
jgi:DNA-binding PadR family transcriptional regulator